ncbi:MAG TPA: ferrochelatase [Gammaproteobacteria bacterium]|jgi:ferrochelatase
MEYLGNPDYRHGTPPATGILISNLGTPDAPTPKALRRYLAEFLGDPRIVEAPRWLWLPVLHGAILRFRPRLSAHAYSKVWTENGSPLLHYSLRQLEALKSRLRTDSGELYLALGMRYGNPSIPSALESLRGRNIERLLVLPLYPQYSATTTASTFDAVSAALRHWRRIPALRFIDNYHDFPPYIAAMAGHIHDSWSRQERGEKLIFSFHGLPRRYLLKGDPYHCQCHKTARLLAEALGLEAGQWQVSFQSRFGREEWLTPYTDHVLKALPSQNVKRVDVFCPGFSVDCLETLEEIEMQNREFFLEAGGERFNYIPALNAADTHIEALARLVETHMQGWEAPMFDAEQSRLRALSMGARQ